MSENTNERRADEGTDGNRRGPAGYLCCKHCKEDSIHDVPTDGHDGPCSTCDDPGEILRERASAAEAERDRARSLAATLEARLVEVEATLWDHPDCIGECACAKNAVDAILNPQGDA